MFVVTSLFDFSIFIAAAKQKQLHGIVVKMKLDKVHERALKFAYPYIEVRSRADDSFSSSQPTS